MNSCFIVGKIRKMPAEEELIGKQKTCIEVMCTRPFPENDGHYQSDVFRVELWRGIVEDVLHSCKVGDAVAIRGRIVNDRQGAVKLIGEHLSLASAF